MFEILAKSYQSYMMADTSASGSSTGPGGDTSKANETIAYPADKDSPNGQKVDIHQTSETSPLDTTTHGEHSDTNIDQHNGDKQSSIQCNTTSVEDNVQALKDELEQLKGDKSKLELEVDSLSTKLRLKRNELEREVERRCDLEQRFTEDAKRSTDQIEELIANSNHDDARLLELQKRIHYYTQETSTMIESFTTHREVLSSQLLELRHENDYLLGKFLTKHRDLQNEAIDLPQTIDELQFYCLTLSEKLILATLAKERLEETLLQNLRGG